jgi:hypothetical protein
MPIDAAAVLAKKLRRESLRVSMGVLRLFPAERRRFLLRSNCCGFAPAPKASISRFRGKWNSQRARL